MNYVLFYGTLFGSFVCGVTAVILAVVFLWNGRFEKGWGYSVSGFFLGTLPIAFITLTILMIIPNVKSVQANPNARQAAAYAEMLAIADANRLCKNDTGHYVTLRVLQDDPVSIQSEALPYIIDTDGTFIMTTALNYSNWKGPYITYQNICTTGNPYTLSQYGSPNDPWGNPYRFFTAKILTNPSPGDPTISPFIQNTLVSYGQDSLPGNNGTTQVGTGDDIVYQF